MAASAGDISLFITHCTMTATISFGSLESSNNKGRTFSSASARSRPSTLPTSPDVVVAVAVAAAAAAATAVAVGSESEVI